MDPKKKEILETNINGALNNVIGSEAQLNFLVKIYAVFDKKVIGVGLIDLSIHFAKELIARTNALACNEGQKKLKFDSVKKGLFEYLEIEHFFFLQKIIEAYIEAKHHTQDHEQYLGDGKGTVSFDDMIGFYLGNNGNGGGIEQYNKIRELKSVLDSNKISVMSSYLLDPINEEFASKFISKHTHGFDATDNNGTLLYVNDWGTTPLTYACKRNLNASVFSMLNNLTAHSDIHLTSKAEIETEQYMVSGDGVSFQEDTKFQILYDDEADNRVSNWFYVTTNEVGDDGKARKQWYQKYTYFGQKTAFWSAVRHQNIVAVILILLHCITRQDYLNEVDLSIFYHNESTKKDGDTTFRNMIEDWTLFQYQTPNTLCKNGDKAVTYGKRGKKTVIRRDEAGNPVLNSEGNQIREQVDNVIEYTGLLGILQKLSFMLPKSMRQKVERACANVTAIKSPLAYRIFILGLEECLYPGKDIRVMSFWLRQIMSDDGKSTDEKKKLLSKYLMVHPEAHRSLHYHGNDGFDVDFEMDFMHEVNDQFHPNVAPSEFYTPGHFDLFKVTNLMHPNPIIYLSKEYNLVKRIHSSEKPQEIIDIIVYLISHTGMSFPAVSGLETVVMHRNLNNPLNEEVVSFCVDPDNDEFKFFSHIIYEMDSRVWFLLRQCSSYVNIDMDLDKKTLFVVNKPETDPRVEGKSKSPFPTHVKDMLDNALVMPGAPLEAVIRAKLKKFIDDSEKEKKQ